MELTPDNVVYARWGFVVINATLVFTWVVMAVLAVGSWLITRNLVHEGRPSRAQSVLETIVEYTRGQIADATQQDPIRYIPFIGTLFLFLAVANFLSFVPGYHPPTGSLSTTSALAVCTFLAVPAYGIASRGVLGYLRRYIEPTPLMLPFHIIGELSRTMALAIRLFGNIMSGTLAVAILVSIAPLVFPMLLQLLGLLIGQVQAYIFAVLATVYIASAARAQRRDDRRAAERRRSEDDASHDDNSEHSQGD